MNNTSREMKESVSLSAISIFPRVNLTPRALKNEGEAPVRELTKKKRERGVAHLPFFADPHRRRRGPEPLEP